MTSDYACLITSSAASSPLTMYVETPSVNSVTIYVTQAAIATGQVDTFVAVAPHGGPTPIYQWYVNGVAVPGQTAATFVTRSLANGDLVKCSMTSSDGCTSPTTVNSTSIKVKVGGAAGVVSLNDEGNFSLVPNPNAGSFIISGNLKNASDGLVNITVTDMLGQSIYKHVTLAANGILNEQVVLPGTIARGMYLVTVTSGEDHVVFHVVIDK